MLSKLPNYIQRGETVMTTWNYLHRANFKSSSNYYVWSPAECNTQLYTECTINIFVLFPFSNGSPLNSGTCTIILLKNDRKRIVFYFVFFLTTIVYFLALSKNRKTIVLLSYKRSSKKFRLGIWVLWKLISIYFS